MPARRITNWISSPKEITIYLFVILLGISYILFVWKTVEQQESHKVLQVAQSIEASLPKEELRELNAHPEELAKNKYLRLKNKLQNVIQVNKNARFAYLYLEHNGKLYFIVDSEPESSPDYSPPGQEFTEADQIDKKPFLDGQAQITQPVTDRWGTWVSAEVPVKDQQTGKIIAVFGMDYNASSWTNRIMFEVIQAILIVLVILILLFISKRSIHRNIQLRKEIEQREKAEKELKESESYFRLLFELNPQPMFVYDLDSMNITAVNNSAIDVYKYSKDEFLSMNILDLKAPSEFSRLWKNLIEDPNSFQHTEIWNHKTKDNQIIQVEVHSHNLDFRQKNARLVLLIDITEKLKTEQELNESRSTLSNLIDNLPGVIYRCALNEEYTMEYLSDACSRITGYSPDDFIKNKTISFNDLILPEYRLPIWEKWQRIREERSIFEEEYPIKTASGEIKWVWERGRCVFNKNNNLDYLEGYIEDITFKKQAEKELRKISQAIKQSPVSIVITNADGIIEYTNPKFTEVTEFEASEAIGKNPRMLKSDMMPPEFYTEFWETISSGKIWTGELINKTKSGRLYWASKSVSPIFDERGKITHYVAVCEDISGKKKTENELIKAKEKAEESDRLKSSFLANISHEIRTPMNGILGFAELLKEPDLTPENQKEFLNMIEKSGLRMLNIINDLIDISKIEAGETTLRIKKTSVNKMLRELHLFFMIESNQKNINLDYHCDLPEEESFIETDSTKLNQVLTNLIKNAVKFTEEGSVVFGYKQKDSMFEFFVTDSGPGIPKEQMDLIFERFRQSTLNLTRKYEGAGLGLAISKAYVELLGGTIWIESELGKGSTFFFTLPVSHLSVN
jgi:PAS domain S-box-containing protein